MMVGALLVRHDVASAAFVRRQLGCDLAYHKLSPAAIEDALLVATELVGNAVRHTRSSKSHTLDVSWDIDASGVRVCVSDPSDDSPRPRVAADDEPDGRGLTIVKAVSDDWGVERSAHGKSVWAHVLAPRPA